MTRPKPTKQVLRETRKRKRALDKEIKRIEAGGAVDWPLMAKFKQECRSSNPSWIKLQQLVAQIQQNPRV